MSHLWSSRRVASRAGRVLAAGALTLLAHSAAAKNEAPRADKPGTSSLKEVGVEFESTRLLRGADRLPALEQVQQSLASLLHGDLDTDQRSAAHLLSGAIANERGDAREAEEAYRRALKMDEDGLFADDAAFATIRALEAQGHDDEALREWPKWEKRYPRSPLLPEARLAQAWNAIRRGKPGDAQKLLTGLRAAAPWMERDPRFALARATGLYLEGRPAEALTVLGRDGGGAPANYLRALCAAGQGSLLRAAALFQEVAERDPESPLRDPALLAKANTFLAARDYRSAAEEFSRTVKRAHDPAVQAEAELRGAACVLLAGAPDSSLALLRGVVERHTGTDVAARAQFLVGEVLRTQGQYAEAIVELNRVLTTYFQHSVAASAQYRVARCLDALGRRAEATSAYQAVVAGYPLEPEAPAAAYLAGVGLLAQNKPLAAAPYFQLTLDRYAARNDSAGLVVFASPAHQELVEAALCLLEYSYHRAGNLGQLSGAPHLLLQRMPPSRSLWRAYALLIDADASAAQARFPESQATLDRMAREFPDHPVGAAATKLLAWTYARQGRDSLAIATEERIVARYGGGGNDELLSASFLDIAHERFNQKRYREAAGAYEEFLRRFPGHPSRLLALYQAGLCYSRVNRAGDAIDRWEAIVRDSASATIAERAWARAGDLYFQAERYEDARRCYRGLLEHFENSSAAAIAMLRLAQCEYNAGRDGAALEAFSGVIARFPDTPASREAARGTQMALYRLGQSPKGAEVLSRLVEEFPNSSFAPDAQFQIAMRRYQQKRWAEAADAFRRVVSQFPGSSSADRAQFLMADAYTQAGNTEQARLAYEQFLSFFPNSELRSTVQFRAGLLHFEAKEYLPAAVLFTRVLEDSASSEVLSAALYNRALCQRLLGSPEEARADLERYRTRYPNDARAAEVAYQLGDLHESANRNAEAIKEYERALAARSSSRLAVELNFRLGRCREQMNDTDGALRAYQAAAAGPDKDDAFRLTAVARCAAIYEAKRDYPRALGAYRDIIRHAKDRELVAAASGRASQLEARVPKR